MYEVGDKVRLTASGVKHMQRHWHEPNVTESDVFEIDTIINACPNNASVGHIRLVSTNPWGWVNEDHIEALELIAPAAPSPKFNVGDRVNVVNAASVRGGQSGKVVQITIRRSGVRYDVLFDDGAAMLFDKSELTLHTPRTWSKPVASNSVGIDVIDTLVDEMTKALRAHGGDCETRRFGDAMVVVENGQAKIYRLEASSECRSVNFV